MEKEKLAKLLKEHLITDDEEFVKAYKDNPPQVQEKLLYQPGEAIISELSKKDLVQLASRYLNNISVYEKNLLHLLIRIEKELTWLCEEKGINVQAKFREDAKKQEELLEARIAASKKKLQEEVNKHKN